MKHVYTVKKKSCAPTMMSHFHVYDLILQQPIPYPNVEPNK